MTEEQYKSFKRLVENNRIKDINRVDLENKKIFEILMKPNKENVSHKYRCEIPNIDAQMIENLNKLMIEQKTMKHNDVIKKIKITTSALLIASSLAGGFTLVSRNDAYKFTAMKETNNRIEQLQKEHPGIQIDNKTRESIYNEVLEERKDNLENYNNQVTSKKEEIEELKRAKAELEQSYYETSNENAKSK